MVAEQEPDPAAEAAWRADLCDDCIRVRQSFEVVTPESASEGEAAERGWVDEAGETFNDTHEVIERLIRAGAVFPSSSVFSYGSPERPGIWYDTEPGMPDLSTGGERTESFFLRGASEGQARRIFEAIERERREPGSYSREAPPRYLDSPEQRGVF